MSYVSGALEFAMWELDIGFPSPIFRRRSISSMEGGSLAPDFRSDGPGLPDNTDSPDGNLCGMSMSA